MFKTTDEKIAVGLLVVAVLVAIYWFWSQRGDSFLRLKNASKSRMTGYEKLMWGASHPAENTTAGFAIAEAP